jgi:uncharacterized protein
MARARGWLDRDRRGVGNRRRTGALLLGGALALVTMLGAIGSLGTVVRAADPVPAGPPFPAPTSGQVVYDQAGVFRQSTIDQVEATIRSIEARTAAGIVVYTQVKPASDTPDLAAADAQALGNQWGVGRKGFDDGLVILFDLDESLVHGQVQLYAGSGYQAAYLSNAERQAIYQDDMLPLLRQGDLDGALLAAMAKVDAAATPAHAQSLDRARQLNAVLGLIGGPLAFVLLVGWAAWSWLRFGRDPVYLDDPSIHIPAPPPGLTPASGALVYEGHTTRRALTTALLDLASRGSLSFVSEKEGPFGIGQAKVGIDTNLRSAADPKEALRIHQADAVPIGPAEQYALVELQGIGAGEPDRYIAPASLLEFGTKVSGFNARLEDYVVGKGWFTEPPGKAINRWLIRGFVVGALGVGAVIGGINLPSDGLVVVGAALVAAGVVVLLIARLMPARTMPGAMLQAMLAAYRRTLDKTMAQARSMDEVVATAGLPWLVTPDQAVVWGVALGLQGQVEQVLERSVSDVQAGRATGAYVPGWYFVGGGGGARALSGGMGTGATGGLMSSSPIPNFGGMMAALGTIGNAPSSSGGGGFGGGGGAGGGF